MIDTNEFQFYYGGLIYNFQGVFSPRGTHNNIMS